MARNYKVGSLESFKANPLNRAGVDVVITRKTPTYDSFDRVISFTETVFNGRVIIANINAKDLQINNSGLNIVGNMKLYWPADLSIKVDDIIGDGERRWRVKTITSEFPPVYNIGVITAIDLN